MFLGRHKLSLCLAMTALLLLASCEREKTDAQMQQSQVKARAHNVDSNDVLNRGKESCLIRAGYGTPDCHVGMPMSEFGAEWRRSGGDDENPIEHSTNAKRGIDFNEKDDRVWNIFFYIRPQDNSSGYACGTDKGVSRTSTRQEVQSVYGDPSFIDQVQYAPLEFGGPPRPVNMTITYVELGIEFRFADEELDVIRVSAPDENFDYEHWQRLMRRTLTYVRPIEKRGKIR